MERGFITRPWAYKLIRTAPFLLVLLVGILGLGLGLPEYMDASGLYQAGKSIQHGIYIRSRTTGFPLYEGFLAVADWIGGIGFINSCSIAFSLGSIAYTRRLIRLIGAPSLATNVAALAVAVHPLFLVNASALSEMSLNVVLALAFTCSSLENKDICGSIKTILFGIALVLTRIDSALWVVALTITHAFFAARSQDYRLMIRWIGLCITIGALSFLSYVIINHGLSFLSIEFLLYDPIWRRITRAAASAFIAFNFEGIVLLGLFVLCTLQTYLAQKQKRADIKFIFLTALSVCLVLYALRFSALPDKLEYILVPIILVLIAGSTQITRPRGIAALCCVGLLQNVATISIFARPDGHKETLLIRPSFAAGPIFQDFRVRRNNEVLTDPRFTSWIASEIPGDLTGFHRVEFSYPGLVSNENVLVISEQDIYRFDNPRFPAPPMHFSAYSAIYICAEQITPPNPWWRTLQIPPESLATEKFKRRENLSCSLFKE